MPGVWEQDRVCQFREVITVYKIIFMTHFVFQNDQTNVLDAKQ